VERDKPTNLESVGQILPQFAQICEVWNEFNIFCTFVTMATAAILNFFNPQKLPHTTVDIPTKFHEV
jgi:hypothetical protein